MIILTNKTYYHNNRGMMYDIYHNGIKAPVIDGLVSLSKVEGIGTLVSIDFYGDSWDYNEIFSSYTNRVMQSIKVLEPNLYQDIYEVRINRFDI